MQRKTLSTLELTIITALAIVPRINLGAVFMRGWVLPPQIPFISNRKGQLISDAQAQDPGYWVDHLRYTVRFADGIATLLEQPGRLLIEVGPGQSLCSFARQQPASRSGANSGASGASSRPPPE